MKNTKPVRSRFFIIAGLLIYGCAGQVGHTGTGSINWPVGTTVTYEVESEQVTTAAIPMGETTTTTSESMTTSVEAIGSNLFEVTITEATKESDASEREQGERAGARTLAGLNSLVRLDDRGLIVETTNLEDNPAVTDNGGPEVVTEGFQRYFLYLPDDHLKPGIEWTREYTYNQAQSDFPLNFHHLDSYRCIEGTTVHGIPAWVIEVTTEMELAGGSTEGSRSISLAGDGQGVLHVARETGMLLNLESIVILNGLFWVMDQEIPVNQTMTTTIQRRP